ncbi:flagellar hook-length control protein FliK [Chitinibacter fontanus]|uniref:Flagellar hook-length control protein FliK n=1 Tax=Chitinibacter fontanus TaxID=1737446 RepID=A0A7D5V8L2_9NEIS|nr:flagellar hook-length control protein FliK [Chitinibacter fontanus]QLI80718.1 flagellar hook-length control protein FliK [Chitinibacter fontanus]
MASGSSNSVNLLNVTSLPSNAKTSREAQSSNAMEFGSQFKNELGKVQTKPADKGAQSKAPEAKNNTETGNKNINEAAYNQQTQAAAADTQQTKLSNAEASPPAEQDEQTAKATDQNALAALLGMMQLAQNTTPALKPEALNPQTSGDSTDGKALIAAIGDPNQLGRGGKTETGVDEDLLAQDQGQGRQKPTLTGLELAGQKSSAADVAVDDMNLLAALPPDTAKTTSKSEPNFADTLANKLGSGMNAPAMGVNSNAALASANATRVMLPTHYIETPVQDARWGEAVAQRVSMMLGKQEQQIEMQLNPPNLGPMEVRLNIGSEQASVVFTSQHAAVREALAAATPKLTALLADQGIVLHNVQVASDSLQQQQQSAFQQQQQGGRFNSQQSASPTGGERLVANLPGIERTIQLNELRVPVGATRVSLFV